MTTGQRLELEEIAGLPSLPHPAVRQASGLLDARLGLSNEEIGRRNGVSANTVRSWRAGFVERGVAGVGVVAQGRGRKPWLPEGIVAEVVRVTLTETPPDTSTHWSTRSLARRLGIGKDTVAEIWRDHQLKPWKVESFKISTDPDFEAKLVDVVGLYMDPPDKAVVSPSTSWVGLRRVDVLTDVTFPQPALRTGRACLHASGSPRAHAFGLCDRS
jgi:transposase